MGADPRSACAEQGELISRQCVPGQTSPCIFEYIYLARPDSVLNDIPVYSFQLGLGTRLADRIRCAHGVLDSTHAACAWVTLLDGEARADGLRKRLRSAGW